MSNQTDPYRPTKRPSMAVLILFDDGVSEGQEFRLLRSEYTVGREDSDIEIPHDQAIESPHLCIKRMDQARPQWHIEDVSQTGGLFVRVRRTLLTDGQQFFLGGHLYEYREPNNAPTTANEIQSLSDGDYSLAGFEAQDRYPVLIWESESGVCKLPLISGMYSLGRHPASSIVRNDPFLADHAIELTCNQNKQWEIDSRSTPNGLWLRLPRITITNSCTFQFGEQRARLRIA